jgi:ABC-type branched-subunit amino acid transport system ATPase component
VPGRLDVADLEVAYGSQQVLFGVSLEVAPGTVTAVLGTNGAGKTTLLRALSGLVPSAGGSVRLDGRDLAGVDAAGRVGLGLVQVAGVFPGLSVLDNLLLGCHRFAWDVALVSERVERVVGVFPVLGDRLDQAAGTLSGGEQQMLALAKALVLDPSVLLIDELTLGLAPVAVHDLLAVLRELEATMVIVEQSVNIALSIADSVALMEKGRITRAGPTASFLERDDLVATVFLRRDT